MPAIVDNLIAYRILTMLVVPFDQTEAYKLGIIDENGNNLIKSKDFTTTNQKDAYTYLHRLVFNIKKILNRLPGGESKTKNLIAAFFLIKESYKKHTVSINESEFHKLLSLLESGYILVEDQMIVDEFVALREEVANVTGPSVSTDQPVIKKKRRFAKFVVNDEVFHKFSTGKTKFRKWSDYLNLEDEGHQMIYSFAKKHPNGVIILQNGQEMKSIRFNRHGGGSWSKIKRTKQVEKEII